VVVVDPSPGPRPDEVHRDRGPPSPLGRGRGLAVTPRYSPAPDTWHLTPSTWHLFSSSALNRDLPARPSPHGIPDGKEQDHPNKLQGKRSDDGPAIDFPEVKQHRDIADVLER
jgi:hypothetical protein